VLKPLIRSEGLVGFSLACYNPQKDPQQRSAHHLVELLANVFGS